MTNGKIVEELGKAREVEKMIAHITESGATVLDPSTIEDLAQDIYLSLLLDKKLPGIYERHQIKFYLSRIVMNNVCSSSSPYYRNYLRPIALSSEITDKMTDTIADD